MQYNQNTETTSLLYESGKREGMPEENNFSFTHLTYDSKITLINTEMEGLSDYNGQMFAICEYFSFKAEDKPSHLQSPTKIKQLLNSGLY